jgi:glycosyltransferase involved in cell wall biosynthesis
MGAIMKRLLWLCTHRTQWREELPLLLEAGFEVVPGRWGHRERATHENLDDPYFLQTWRQHCTLPSQTLERLRSVNWFHEAPPDVIPLACEALDGVIVESFVDSLLLIARWFPKAVFFRVFGHAGETSYSFIAGTDVLHELSQTACYQNRNYHWCPILPTLTFVEEEILAAGEIVLEPFVTLPRLPFRWQEEKAEPYVALVLSRLVEVSYYQSLYRRIVSAFRRPEGAIPLRVLGQNPAEGDALADTEIIGKLEDQEYFRMIARATAFFYQGDSIGHLHWCALEALAMGVPVVMMEIGFLAWALKRAAGPEAQGESYGVVQGLDHANRLLTRCLQDPSVAAAIALRQRPLARYVTDRDLAVKQYRARLGAALGEPVMDQGILDLGYKLSA